MTLLENRPLSLALPKGRFQPQSQQLLLQWMPDAFNNPRRCSWTTMRNDTLVKIKLLKSQDIAALLATQEIDAGVLPDEWVLEKEAPAVPLLDLRWCLSRIVFAGDPSLRMGFGAKLMRVATSYPNLAARCLRDIGHPVEIRYIHGSAECFVPDMCDAIFDCVETGATLRAHGLEILKTYLESSVRLYAASNAKAETLRTLSLFQSFVKAVQTKERTLTW
jgi:ATP phosphoribosyltransferase